MFNVNQTELIEKVSQKLKENKQVSAPEWAPFAKTGTHKQRVPDNQEWWFVRAAAVLRKVAVLGPVGVSKLRTAYGGKKRRGHQPAEFRKGSGNIIRTIFQQLEKSQLIRQSKPKEFGVHKGRIITGQGQSLLDNCANDLLKSQPKKSKQMHQEPSGETHASVPAVEQKKEVQIKKEQVPAQV